MYEAKAKISLRLLDQHAPTYGPVSSENLMTSGVCWLLLDTSMNIFSPIQKLPVVHRCLHYD